MTMVDAFITSLDVNNGKGHAGKGMSTLIPNLIASNLSDPGSPAATISETGSTEKESAFHFDSLASASPLEDLSELNTANDLPVQFVGYIELKVIVEEVPPPLEDHVVHHNSNAVHPAVIYHNGLLL